MKKLIKTTLSLAAICLLATTVPAMAYVQSAGEMKSVDDLIGIAGREYNTEVVPYSQAKQQQEVKGIFVSTNQVVLEHNGLSEFVDVLGEMENGNYINLANDVEWISDNDEVVFADAGRILALAPGETTVTVIYGDYKESISVSVLDSFDIESEVERLNAMEPEFSTNGFSSSDRTTVIDIAKGMVNLEWKPTKNLKGWKDKKTFEKNTTYTGIPYSQTEYQKDKDGFNKALKASDFYDSYTRFSIVMPKYGSDCSGFVSFSWGISRKTTADFVSGIKNGTYAKVGSYDADNPTQAKLKEAYKKLQKADAVVKDGHTFIIASNDTTNSKVYAYEQTPYLAQYTTWTYDTMAKDGYMPFTKK